VITDSTPDVPSDRKPSPASAAPTPIPLVAVSPPPPCNGHVIRETKVAGDPGTYNPRLAAPFDDRGHLPAAQAACLKKIDGPCATFDIKPKRSGCIRWVCQPFARQPQTKVVFGQEHASQLPEDVGLVPGDPHQFRRGEPQHGPVAGQLMQHRRALKQFVALADAAHVIPENGGTQDAVIAIKQHGAVHLPRQANRTNPAVCRRMIVTQRGKCCARGPPPVVGVLFRPPRPGPRKGQRMRHTADGDSTVGQEHGFQFRCAEINAKKHEPFQIARRS
jgi:hypothetical protein